MFIKASPGMRVRDPVTKRVLPEEGKEVPESTFWIRRLQDGDVVIVPPEPPALAIEPATVVHHDPIPDSESTSRRTRNKQ